MVLARLNFRHQIVLALNKDTPISCDILEIVPQCLLSDKGRIQLLKIISRKLKEVNTALKLRAKRVFQIRLYQR